VAGQFKIKMYLCKVLISKIMQAYKFDTKISENGIIALPYAMPNLYGKEVELFIVVPQQEEKIELLDADIPQWEKDFIDQRLDRAQHHPECLNPVEMLFEAL
jgi:hypothetical protein